MTARVGEGEDSVPNWDMKKVAANVGKSLRTVRRQIARAIEAGEIQQVKHGEYKKM